MLAGFVAIVILAIHFLGGSSAPASSANSGDQASGNPSGSGSSTPVISSGNGSNQVLDATAQALGITTDTLKADLQSGETVAQIAQAQNVPISTVNAAYLNGVKELSDQMVQGGSVSQATADQLYQEEQQKVQNGQYDLLNSGGGHVIVSNGQVTTGG